MAGIDRLLHALRRLSRGEEGMALPFALFAMVAAMGLASAAVMSSVNVQQGSHRDSDAKSAIAAADAGANVALMRLNRYAAALSTAPSTNCLGVSGDSLVVTGAVNGWCPPIEGAVGGSTYSYQASAMIAGGTMSVVSTGASGGVRRRVLLSLSGGSGGGVLGTTGLIGQDGITLTNSAQIKVGVGTNGNISLTNSATICGDIRHGVDKEVTYKNSSKQCSGYAVTEGNVDLPSVSSFMPADISMENTNYRLNRCESVNPQMPTGCGLDIYSSNNPHTQPWNPAKREISLTNSSSLTLGGKDYFICRLSISNSSELIMAADAHVRIFFDTPEHCPGVSTTQIDISNSSRIKATAYRPELGRFDMPGLYLLGSESQSTYVEFNNSSGSNEFLLYAPNSDIDFDNSATFKGPIAGKTIDLQNSVKIDQDEGYEPPVIGGETLYSRQSYVECGGAAALPDENC